MAGDASTMAAVDPGGDRVAARAQRAARARPADVERAAGSRVGIRRLLLGALLPVLVVVAAEVAVRCGWIDSALFPSPVMIAAAIGELGPGVVAGHVGISTARVFAGFAIGATSAIVLGTGVGLSRTAEDILEPSFQALRAIPSLAWVPLLLLWLGIDETPKLVLIAIGAFFPVYMGVASGLRDVDRKLVEVARLCGFGPARLALRVLLPAAMPSIWTGLRNGLSLAWMFMVAAELIAASRGLGYLLTDGRETGRADLVLAAIVLLAVLGKLSDGGMRWLERRLLGWRDTAAR